MSRIGVQPVVIPDGVEVKLEGSKIMAKGSKGELSLELHKYIEAEIKDGKEVVVKPKNLEKPGARALWGTFRVLVANLVKGVSEGYEKKMEVNGTGYKAAVSGKKLVLDLGYSHSIEIEAPEGITFAVDKNEITVSGIDKQLVGEIAAQVRSKRKVEPYKGKGIKYVDEYVRRKEGKKAAGEGE